MIKTCDIKVAARTKGYACEILQFGIIRTESNEFSGLLVVAQNLMDWKTTHKEITGVCRSEGV